MFLVLLLSSVYIALSHGPAAYSGYLINVWCYESVVRGGLARDSADVIRAPWEHTVACLRGTGPSTQTYYLAENQGSDKYSSYHMKFVLDDVGNQNALAAALASRRVNDFKVTARGIHDGNGNLVNATIQECFGHFCDGVCDGSCETSAVPRTTVPPTGFTTPRDIPLSYPLRAKYSICPGGRHINFSVILNADSWLAFGISDDGTMTSGGVGSDVFVCSDGQVKRYWMTSKLWPTGGVDVADAECSHGPVTTMKFSRKAMPQSTRERPINIIPGFETVLIWAHGAHAGGRAMRYHGSLTGSTLTYFGLGGTTTSTSTTTTTVLGRQAVDPEQVKLGDDVSMHCTLSQDRLSITVTVTYNGDGWLGIGISPDGTMAGSGAGSDIMVCSDGHVKRYWVTSRPFYGNEVLGAECQHGPTTRMVFTRRLHADYRTQRSISIQPGVHSNIIWAHGSSRTMKYHMGASGSVLVDVGALTEGAAQSAVPLASLWLHAGLMLFASGILLPLGVVWPRFQRQRSGEFQNESHRSAYCKTIESVALVLQLVGFTCGVIYIHHRGGSHFSTTHSIFGLAVVMLCVLQFVGALCRRHPRANDQNNYVNSPTTWEYVHRGAGHVALVAGILNVVIGIAAAANTEYGVDFTLNVATAAGLSFGSVPVFVMCKFLCSNPVCRKTNPPTSNVEDPGAAL